MPAVTQRAFISLHSVLGLTCNCFFPFLYLVGWLLLPVTRLEHKGVFICLFIFICFLSLGFTIWPTLKENTLHWDVFLVTLWKNELRWGLLLSWGATPWNCQMSSILVGPAVISWGQGCDWNWYWSTQEGLKWGRSAAPKAVGYSVLRSPCFLVVTSGIVKYW